MSHGGLVRTTVNIRRGALIAAAAMACAAIGSPTPGVGLADLFTGGQGGRLLGTQAASAYPFNPWALPVHPPVPGELPLPPALTPPTPQDPFSTPAPTETYPTPTIPGSAVSGVGIPANVLAAYQRAADAMAARDSGCHLTWPVLAGIGRIESNHAAGGNLRADGTTVSRIIGIALDGRPGVASIRDSDSGALDGDSVWDRAVGPMQFLPGTWAVFGQDGNGDGRRDPHNIHDATLAAAVYLCQGDRDLRVESNLRAALYAYNPSTSYVNTVIAWIRAYERGGVPIDPTPGSVPSQSPAQTPAQSPTPATTPTPAPTLASDTSEPTVPRGVQATVLTATSVDLTWTAATDDRGVTSYEIYRDGVLVATTTGTSHTVGGLVGETPYVFTVRARDAAGNRSLPSSPVTVVIDTTAPGTPGNLRVTARAATEVQLAWDAAVDNVGVAGYEVFQSGEHPTAGTGTTHTVIGLTEDQTYTFSVLARDAAGNVSEEPATVEVSTDVTAPSAPTGLVLTSRTPTAIDLAWIPATDNNGEVDYEVAVRTTDGGAATGVSVTVDEATAQVTGLAEGTAYDVTVRAVDPAGNASDAIDSAKATIAADRSAPNEPANLSISVLTADSARLTWDPSTDVDVAEYVVLQDGTPVLAVAGTTTTAEITDLAPDTTHRFTVVVRGTDGRVSALPSEVCFPDACEEEEVEEGQSPDPTTESPSAEPTAQPPAEPTAQPPAESPAEPPVYESGAPAAEPSNPPAREDEASSQPVPGEPEPEPDPEPDPDPEGSPETTAGDAAAVQLLADLGSGETAHVEVGSAEELRTACSALISGGTVVSGPALQEPMEWIVVDADVLWVSDEPVWVLRSDGVLVGLIPGEPPVLELRHGTTELTASTVISS